MEISEADLIKEIELLMRNERLIPEPQFSSFSKYLSTINEKSNNSIVHLANSQGVHLRQEVNYLLQRRLELNENPKNKCPITEPTHLELFKDYNDVIKKLKELPSEWTVIQITKGFSPYDAVSNNMEKNDSTINIARFPCGDVINHIPPYHITVDSSKQSQGNLMTELSQLIKARRDYYKTGKTSKKLQEEYNKTDNSLMSFVNELENHCLKEWKCLLNGRLEDSKLEIETKNAVKLAIENFFKKQNKSRKLDEKNLDIIYLATISAHVMKNSDLLRILSYVLKENENESLNEFFPLMENLKLINLSNGCAVKRAAKKPVILIIDPVYEEAPWEMISTLQGQPVSRILSLHLLYSLFKYHENSIIDGYYRLRISNAYSLVNPEKDLDKCEKCLKNFLNKEFPWVVADLGKQPDPQILLTRLQESSIYFYCGHGSGTQYLNPIDLKKSIIKGMIMLFGCCSNLPKSTGGRTPYQNHTYTYIINGCPCLIGCLHDVNSTETDAVCLDMLSNVMPVLENKDGKKIVNQPKEPDVLKALVAAKKKCNKYWTTCSFVARGIPCKTAAGKFDS